MLGQRGSNVALTSTQLCRNILCRPDLHSFLSRALHSSEARQISNSKLIEFSFPTSLSKLASVPSEVAENKFNHLEKVMLLIQIIRSQPLNGRETPQIEYVEYVIYENEI